VCLTSAGAQTLRPEIFGVARAAVRLSVVLRHCRRINGLSAVLARQTGLVPVASRACGLFSKKHAPLREENRSKSFTQVKEGTGSIKIKMESGLEKQTGTATANLLRASRALIQSKEWEKQSKHIEKEKDWGLQKGEERVLWRR
jgi:hypothetical protein